MTRIKEFWTNLNEEITVNRRELVLGVAACALAGVVIGMLMAPPKDITIGSGNNIIGDAHMDDEDEEEAAEEQDGE